MISERAASSVSSLAPKGEGRGEGGTDHQRPETPSPGRRRGAARRFGADLLQGEVMWPAGPSGHLVELPGAGRKQERAPWISESAAARPSSVPRAAGSAAPARGRWREAGCEVVDQRPRRRGAGDGGRGAAPGDRRQGRTRSRPTSPRRKARRRCSHACPEPDILVNNNAGPPFRDFRELDAPADDRRRDRQHGGGDRADAEGDRPDDRAKNSGASSTSPRAR